MAKKKNEENSKPDLKAAASKFLSISKSKFKDMSKYGSVLSESIYSEILEYIDTGSYALNRLISGSIYGGIPAGRVVSFYGDSGVGKSFAIGQAIRDAQEKGYLVIFYDTENAITKTFMENIGVDSSTMIYQPLDTVADFKNHVIHTVTDLKKEMPNQKIMIALDSMGNLSCEQEKGFIEKKTGQVTQGGREREIKSMLKELTKFCGLHQIPLVFTNHSMKPQDTAMAPQYVKDKQGGGKQATYMASATILMTKKKLKADDASTEDKKNADGNKKVGNILVCESTKNRLCPEEEKIDIYLSFKTGPNRFYGLAEDAVSSGAFEKVNERNFIVKHLDKKIHIAKLYNKEVFTKDVLDQIDEYCKKTYVYSSLTASEDVEIDLGDEGQED